MRLVNNSIASSLSYQYIKNCPISDVKLRHTLAATRLTLENEAAIEILKSSLTTSHARTGRIRNCPSFPSLIMDHISQGLEIFKWICPRLTGLSIHGVDVSNQISMTSIKNLVDIRQRTFDTLQASSPLQRVFKV
jgi:hypothetical protein